MEVLVIGYGKIGHIKSFIWHSLDRGVYVYDTDARKKEQAKADGFKLHSDGHEYGNELIVDISTPASYHLESLEWVLNTIKPTPKVILIEKPLASHQEELDALTRLLSREGLLETRSRVVVNESYYLSSALGFVADDIQRLSSKVRSVRTELSKNRLQDVINGRFVDEHLGSLGIELPHMIAMVQRLGFDLKELSIEDVSVYQKKDATHNEGFRLSLLSDKTPLIMESYLGDFRVTDDSSLVANGRVVRTLEVATDSRVYKVEFDPIRGLGRYKARVRTYDSEGNLLKTVVLDDDHLADHLKKLHQADKSEGLDSLFSVENALEIAKYIFSLKEKAVYKQIRPLLAKESNHALGRDEV